MLSDGRKPWNRPAVGPEYISRISDHEALRVTWDRKILFNWNRSVGLQFYAERPRQRHALHASAPQHRCCLDTLFTDGYACRINLSDGYAKPYLDPSTFQLSLCIGRMLFAKGRKQSMSAFNDKEP